MTGAGHRSRTVAAVKAAAATGTALRLLDRVCAAGYVGFTVYVAVQLVEAALTHTLWLLLMIVPVAISAVLLFPSLYRSPDLGLRLMWPLRRTMAMRRPGGGGIDGGPARGARQRRNFM